MKALFEYFAASRIELAKVTWPSRRQTMRLTFLVIIFSLIFAATLGIVDYLFSELLRLIIIKG